MKEVDLSSSFGDFIQRHTPDYGVKVTYPDGTESITVKFKSHFEAQWWQINVTNPFAMDNNGHIIKSSIIIRLKK